MWNFPSFRLARLTLRVDISGKTDFEPQNPSQVLDVGGPSVVALCGGFDGGVDPIPDDLGRDALDDPVKDLGLGNPIAGGRKCTSDVRP